MSVYDQDDLRAYEAAHEEGDEVVMRRLVDAGVMTTAVSPYYVCCFQCQEPVFQDMTVRLIEDQLCCSDRCALRAWEEQHR